MIGGPDFACFEKVSRPSGGIRGLSGARETVNQLVKDNLALVEYKVCVDFRHGSLESTGHTTALVDL